MSSPPSIFLLFVLVAVSWALRLCFSPGLALTDDTQLYEFGVRLSQHFSIETLMQVPYGRLGIPVLLSAVFRLLGAGETALMVFGLMLNTLTLLMVYVLAQKFLEDTRWALISVIGFIVSPLDIQYAASAFPDALGNFTIMVAVFCLYKGLHAEALKTQSLWCLFYGLVCGLALFSKESAVLLLVLLLPMVLFCVLSNRSIGGKLLLCALGATGFGLVMAGETILNAVAFNEPLHRFIERNGGNANTALYNQFRYSGLIDKLFTWIHLILRENPYDFLICILASIVGVSLFTNRTLSSTPAFKLLLFWFFGAFAVLLFSSVFTYSYQPRRLLPLILPSIFLTTLWLKLSWTHFTTVPWQRLAMRGATAVFAGLLLYTTVVMINGRFHPSYLTMSTVPVYCRYKTADARAVANYIYKQLPVISQSIVITDSVTHRALRIFMPQHAMNRLKILPYERKDQYPELTVGTPLRHFTAQSQFLILNRVALNKAKVVEYPETFYHPPFHWPIRFQTNHTKPEQAIVIVQLANLSPDINIQRVSLPIPGLSTTQPNTGWQLKEPNTPEAVNLQTVVQNSEAVMAMRPDKSNPIKLQTVQIPLDKPAQEITTGTNRVSMMLRYQTTQYFDVDISVQERDKKGHRLRKYRVRRDRTQPGQNTAWVDCQPLPEATSLTLNLKIRGKGAFSLYPPKLYRETLLTTSTAQAS